MVGLPDCEEVPAGDSLSPITSQASPLAPGLSTDTFEQLGIPIPENYSAPSTGALEDTLGVHMQAFRLGDILFTVCSCEQWVEQSYNIKTRTDRQASNEYVGYDPTSPNADPTNKCVRKNAAFWTCTVWDYPKVGQPQVRDVPDNLIQHMRAEINNPANGWDDPNCQELGCGYQAESEPTDPAKIRGNYTNDDTSANASKGYKLTFTIAMANDYNGYIASYREFMDHDHYRKALTGWGPHSSDYFATRLSQLGRALNGDNASQAAIDAQSDPSKADAAWAPFIAKETADQAQEEAKVQAVGQAAAAGVKAYTATLPNDGGSDKPIVQPKDIERFDAATFTWDGGNNFTDNPVVTVERETAPGVWRKFADQSGEIPVTLKYPDDTPDGIATYRTQPKEWKWTATFEAFVSRFPLVDPQGDTYTATPAGNYRFVVNGAWRKGGRDEAYRRVSREFTVSPWSGITVEGAKLDSAGHVVFGAGPTHTIAEQTARSTARPPFVPGNAPVKFTIGPVDFPDIMKTPAASGARFLSPTRGYSGTGMDEVEHYCLDCSFRPWLDATGQLVAKVKIGTTTETVKPDANGQFKSVGTAASGDKVTITIRDAWGDTSPATQL